VDFCLLGNAQPECSNSFLCVFSQPYGGVWFALHRLDFELMAIDLHELLSIVFVFRNGKI
jgi:hypothetical protein